jgi:hypothetical protein
MKPDWSSPAVPEWAAYAAQELSGSYLWHEFKPTYLAITGEWRSSGRWAVVPKVSLRPEQTLEQRPLPEESAEERLSVINPAVKAWLRRYAPHVLPK